MLFAMHGHQNFSPTLTNFPSDQHSQTQRRSSLTEMVRCGVEIYCYITYYRGNPSAIWNLMAVMAVIDQPASTSRPLISCFPFLPIRLPIQFYTESIDMTCFILTVFICFLRREPTLQREEFFTTVIWRLALLLH